MSERDRGNFFIEELDRESDSECVVSELSEVGVSIKQSSSRKYEIGISEDLTDKLYDLAGTEETEQNNETVVYPSPHILTTRDERLVMEAKEELSVPHELDY